LDEIEETGAAPHHRERMIQWAMRNCVPPGGIKKDRRLRAFMKAKIRSYGATISISFENEELPHTLLALIL
jgi:hypothetical protein